MNIFRFRAISRREFVRDCLRFGAGGGLILFGVILGFRNNSKDENNDDCTLRNPCQGCNKYVGCNLPRAQNVKKTKIPATL